MPRTPVDTRHPGRTLLAPSQRRGGRLIRPMQAGVYVRPRIVATGAAPCACAEAAMDADPPSWARYSSAKEIFTHGHLTTGWKCGRAPSSESAT